MTCSSSLALLILVLATTGSTPSSWAWQLDIPSDLSLDDDVSEPGQVTKRSQMDQDQAARYCGRQLIAMLQLVCRMKSRNRRETATDDAEDYLKPQQRLWKRGASDCCRTSCTIRQLQSFCP